MNLSGISFIKLKCYRFDFIRLFLSFYKVHRDIILSIILSIINFIITRFAIISYIILKNFTQTIQLRVEIRFYYFEKHCQDCSHAPKPRHQLITRRQEFQTRFFLCKMHVCWKWEAINLFCDYKYPNWKMLICFLCEICQELFAYRFWLGNYLQTNQSF